MKAKKKWGIVMLILGALLIGSSFYIKSQVVEGQKKVANVEKSTDLSDKLFSVTPETEELGDTLSSPIKGKVSEGKEQIAFYTALANGLEIGGMLLAVLGIGLIFLGKKSKS